MEIQTIVVQTKYKTKQGCNGAAIIARTFVVSGTSPHQTRKILQQRCKRFCAFGVFYINQKAIVCVTYTEIPKDDLYMPIGVYESLSR